VFQRWIVDPSSNRGLMIKFVNETCEDPRFPAEFDPPTARFAVR